MDKAGMECYNTVSVVISANILNIVINIVVNRAKRCPIDASSLDVRYQDTKRYKVIKLKWYKH